MAQTKSEPGSHTETAGDDAACESEDSAAVPKLVAPCFLSSNRSTNQRRNKHCNDVCSWSRRSFCASNHLPMPIGSSGGFPGHFDGLCLEFYEKESL
ncbi:MAG TPA: hypothetical protein PKE31_07925 [Pseudomonadota bacterium]|nr:hypothetical protein [Pseudomonadota bacterium]